MKPIGTVEILRTRIYALDAEAHSPTQTEVIVEPGTYDLFEDDGCFFWLMRGVIDRRGAWRIGDGMYVLNGSDEATDIAVVFPSRRFGPDEWEDLLSRPESTEGPQQRLRIHLLEAAP